MRLSIGASILVVAVCSVIFCGFLLRAGGWSVGRLVLHRLVLPSAERQLCSVKRKVSAGFAKSWQEDGDTVEQEDEACNLQHRQFMEAQGTGYWAETIQTTASEIVAKAHAELHFTQRIVLLGSTQKSERPFIGEDLIELGATRILGCAAAEAKEEKRETETETAAPTSPFRAWLIQGFSLANVLVGEFDNELFVIDTGDMPKSFVTMMEHFNKHSCGPPKPVSLVLISHYHTDHIGGIGGVYTYDKSLNYSKKPVVLAHEETAAAITQYFLVHPQSSLRRAQKQFGVSKHVTRARLKQEGAMSLMDNATTPGVISAGIGLSLDAVNPNNLSGDIHSLVQYPTHTWSTTQKVFKFHGHPIDMMKSPGETADQITFYLPSLRVYFIADNFYFAFPNIYPLRGGVFRNPADWWKSLDVFLNQYAKKTDVLAMGHTSPVLGTTLIILLVERYRDSIQFIRDQTIRLMNHLDDGDVIARNVARLFWRHFPKLNPLPYSKSMLKSMPILLMDPVMPFYGQLHWAAKAVVFRERGWFGGRVEEVNSHRVSLSARYRKLKYLIDSPDANILEAINQALSSFDCQWALELTTIAMAPRTHFGLPTSPTFEVCMDSPNTSETAELGDPDLREIFDDWRNQMCSANRTAASTWTPVLNTSLVSQEELLMESDADASGQDDGNAVCRPYTEEVTPSLRCARKQALWCLARRELPSSGRNWYVLDSLSDAHKDSDEADSIKTAHQFRNSFLGNAPDLINVLHSFPSRLEPGVMSFQNIPTVFRVHFIRDEEREIDDFQDFNKLAFGNDQVVDIISRNSILIIQEQPSTPVYRDPSDPNFIEIYTSWSVFRSLLLKVYPAGPLRMWARSEIWFKNDRPRTQRFRDFCKFLELLLAIEHE
eukprot:Gregarina_sp_Pseudo_9__44@NODE_102_length_4267_cov_34_192526_g94_i0_p1_GENE_NODE_102_length_4267_cov_34_192526_g94_i0NODE_102_length_4267_cov_34_192526_g94_i0_p1_ORF_typecomplete_len886_score168_76Lactamase_B/PF00753_27/2_2e11Alkyl_sulf_dimr/PF14863_6/3_1e09Lactamase_B_2/PF12706_7/2e05Lactamase_B_6/PF16661_5/0_00055Lactamase_B_3/PF13483_6/0_061_NODE_102_length_4267_cov_34_192526_g94_i0912748